VKRLTVVVVILALCVLALLANTRWVDSQTRAAAPRDGGRIIDASVVPANVKVEGNGPAIVLIHGFGAAIDWWDEIAPALAVDHRVIRIDLIGHGGTEAPRSGYSIVRQAALVSAILDKLGVDGFTVIGHSMGGEVATALAERNPQRIERMVLIDSPPTTGLTFNPLTQAYLKPVLGEFLNELRSDEAIRRGLEQGFAPGFPVPEKFVADLKQLTYTAFRSAHDESIAYRSAKPTYERLAALKPVPPLLAMSGTLDAIVPPKDLKLFEQVPGAKLAMVEGAGHSPMVESPAKVLALIRDFIATRPPDAN
jgi:pimeloyl-ACP methyl ester carboxylesterase